MEEKQQICEENQQKKTLAHQYIMTKLLTVLVDI